MKCNECGKDLSSLLKRDKRRKFCSRSCAAKYNNKKFPKRGDGTKTTCPSCGGFKYSDSQLCHECFHQEQINQMLNSPISKYKIHGERRQHLNNSIRSWARKTYKRSGKPLECEVCGFDIVVEIDHIKPIADFPDTALMKEVNSLDNLMCLCPNHHAMKERNLLLP